jgi:hypothetical protein
LIYSLHFTSSPPSPLLHTHTHTQDLNAREFSLLEVVSVVPHLALLMQEDFIKAVNSSKSKDDMIANARTQHTFLPAPGETRAVVVNFTVLAGFLHHIATKCLDTKFSRIYTVKH